MSNPNPPISVNGLTPQLQPPPTLTFAADTEESRERSRHGLLLHHLLVLALRSRDELLWTEFIRRSQPVIAGVVTKTIRRWAGPTSSLVDDLVQETYLKLFAENARALRKFVCRHENALYGFLKVVASNVVQDHFRCMYSQKRGSGRWEESIEHDGGISVGEGRRATEVVNRGGQSGRATVASTSVRSALEDRILFRQIDACLKAQWSGPNFSRDYSIFWLYYGDGLSAKAISCIPSIRLSVKGVESLLFRLTRLMQLKMAPQRLKATKMAKDAIESHVWQ